jgi:hypothetical protein
LGWGIIETLIVTTMAHARKLPTNKVQVRRNPRPPRAL